jgi:peptidoglycan/LPS O-acetylase OafA/YrhL
MQPQKPRYDSLDAWRGLACLLVVVFHSVLYVTGVEFDSRVRSSGGSFWEWTLVVCSRFWIGVPLFFVISGYCIAASADAARDRRGGVRRYFVRRFRRIYPPLFAVLAVAAVFCLCLLLLPPSLRLGPTPDGSDMTIDPRDLSVWQWAGNLTLTEEWRPALGGPPKGYLLGQTWTLCYEEQFYLVVGLLLLVAGRRFFAGVCAVTVLVVLNLLNLNALVGDRLGLDLNALQVKVPGLFINGLWLTFAAGVAVYYRLHHAGPRRGAFLEFGLLLFALTWAVVPTGPIDNRSTLSQYNAVGCAFAVVLCLLHRFDTRTAGAACLAPLRFCGRMCYSLYLIHPLATAPVAWFFFRAGLTSPAATVLVTVPVAAALSILLSWLFYRLVERQFLNSPGKLSPVGAVGVYIAPQGDARSSTPTGIPPCPAVCSASSS